MFVLLPFRAGFFYDPSKKNYFFATPPKNEKIWFSRLDPDGSEIMHPPSIFLLYYVNKYCENIFKNFWKIFFRTSEINFFKKKPIFFFIFILHFFAFFFCAFFFMSKNETSVMGLNFVSLFILRPVDIKNMKQP